MRNILTLILLVFMFFGCKDKFSDESKRNEHWVWWVDAKTKKAGWIPVNKGEPVKNGRYTRFYFNGKKFSTGRLVDGIDVDTSFYYDLAGNLEEYQIGNDVSEYFVKNGPIKLLFADGSISATGIVKNHTYGDKWISYFANRKISVIRNLQNDTGYVTTYYSNGNVSDSDYYLGKDNSFNIKHWYENGQLARSSELKNGAYNGVEKQYYSNGRLKGIGNHVNGKIEGEEKFWYDDGKLQSIGYMTNGVANGRLVLYYENGNIKIECYAKKGKLDGERKKYNESGGLMADEIYKDGAVVETKVKDQFGVKYQ